MQVALLALICNFPLGVAFNIMEAQQAFSIAEENFTGLGETNLLAEPVKQPLTQFFFQHPALSANGRLGAIQLFDSHREALVSRDFVEVATLIEVHGIFISTSIQELVTS